MNRTAVLAKIPKKRRLSTVQVIQSLRVMAEMHRVIVDGSMIVLANDYVDKYTHQSFSATGHLDYNSRHYSRDRREILGNQQRLADMNETGWNGELTPRAKLFRASPFGKK